MTDDPKATLVQLASGDYIERDVLNIVEKIYEYDENLKLQYVPTELADISDAPYQLVEMCPDGQERVVFYIWKLDERVLERLYAADTKRFDVLKALEDKNTEVFKERQYRYEEKMLEGGDIMEHVLKSPKGRYSFKNEEGEVVTVDDDPHRTYKVQ